MLAFRAMRSASLCACGLTLEEPPPVGGHDGAHDGEEDAHAYPRRRRRGQEYGLRLVNVDDGRERDTHQGQQEHAEGDVAVQAVPPPVLESDSLSPSLLKASPTLSRKLSFLLASSPLSAGMMPNLSTPSAVANVPRRKRAAAEPLAQLGLAYLARHVGEQGLDLGVAHYGGHSGDGGGVARHAAGLAEPLGRRRTR